MADIVLTSQTLGKDAAVVKAEGEFDAGNFGALEDEFSKLLDSGVVGIVMDFAGVTGITSAVVGALIDMSGLLAKRKGGLVLAAARPGVAGTFEMLGIADALAFADSVDAARKSLPVK